MGCLVFIFAMIGPRFALGFVWIFTTLVDRAYDNFFVPALGFVFLPWTTLMYALAFNGHTVSPLGWFFVALGLLGDVSSIAGSGRRGQQMYYA